MVLISKQSISCKKGFISSNGVPSNTSISLISIIFFFIFSSLTIENPILLGLWGDREAKTPLSFISLGGITFNLVDLER